MVNDFFDRSVDRIVGKSNALAALSQPVAISLVVASCALGLIIAIPLLSTTIDAALVLITYGLITTYSAPPLRFKERGVGALLVATATQRTLPALIIFHMLSIWDQSTILFSAFISVVGIHCIITHQITDAENDRRSGMQTLAVARGTKALHQLLKYLIFVEVICLTLFILAIALTSNMLAILGVYGAWFLINLLRN
jgi:4-hydroxybenzoate polyprenyltransferase